MIQRRPRSEGNGTTEPLRASLPSGNWTVGPGIWLADVADLHRDLLDILYGPARPRSGEGWVEMDGSRGRYRIWRSFQTGQAKIIGRCIPDPGLIPPGEFLLGHDRDAEEGSLQPDSGDLMAHVRTSASLLQSRAEQMMRHAGRFAPVAVPIAPSEPVDDTRSREALSRLDQAIRRFHDLEAERLERQTAWEKTLDSCARRLASPSELAKNSASIQELEALFEEWNQLQAVKAPKPLRSMEFLPWLVSLGLAGLGLIAAGRFLAEGLITAFGFAMVLGTLLPYPLAALRRQRAVRDFQRQKNGLQARLKKALLKAKVLPPSGDLDVPQVREAIARARVRDGLGEVRETLSKAIPGEKVQDIRGRLVSILREGVGEEISNQAAQRWEDDPLLALPSLLRDLGGALDAERDEINRPPEVMEVQQDASVALRQEAGQLFRRAAALKRMLAADEYLDNLVGNTGPTRHSLHTRMESHRERGGTWPLFLGSEWLPQNLGAWRAMVERIVADPPGQAVLVAPPEGLSALEALEELPQSLRNRIGVLMPQRLLSRSPARPRRSAASAEARAALSEAN